MTIKEKIFYLKGLAEAKDLKNNELGKLISVIIDTISDMADELKDLNENALAIGDELDELSDDLATVEQALEGFGVEFDDDDGDYEDDDYEDDDVSGKLLVSEEDDDEDDDDYEDGHSHGCDHCGGSHCGGCSETDYSIDVTCPNCGTEIELDELDIENESVICPDCKNKIELEIDVVESDDEY